MTKNTLFISQANQLASSFSSKPVQWLNSVFDVKSMLPNCCTHTGETIWMGGYDMFKNDEHRWLDGILVSSGFTNWHPSDPSNGGQNSMIILSDRRWSDAFSWGNFKYMCESGLM